MKRHKSLPAHAKKVFHGQMYEIWQWEQDMYDGSTEIFERAVRPNVVNVIAIVGDNILVNEESQPDLEGLFYSLPGGRMEQETDSLHEAKRELREETGYISDDWSLWKEVPVGVTWILGWHYYFIARNCTYAGAPELDPGERITVSPMSFEDFLLLSDNSRLRNENLRLLLLELRLNTKAKEKFRKLLFP